MTSPVVIIVCDGSATRWAWYLGKPKQFVDFDGEPMLHRTVRQCNERGITPFVVAPVAGGNEWDVPGATRVDARHSRETMGGTDRYWSSRHLWSFDGPTVILHGDVWFSDEALRRIFEEVGGDWRAFVRPGGNKLTGKPGAEMFGCSFGPEAQPEFLAGMEAVADLFSRRVITRSIGLEVWRYMAGLRDGAVQARGLPVPLDNPGRAVVIDDWTDDVDKRDDFVRQTVRRAAFAPVEPGVTSVVIPWRPSEAPDRHRNFAAVLDLFAQHFPEWEVCIADDGAAPTEPWSASTARLRAIAKSRGDVLVMIDADAWSYGLGHCVDYVREHGGFCQPHTTFRRLDGPATERALRTGTFSTSPADMETPAYSQRAGAMPVVIERALAVAVPTDQRFRGWGGEDCSWGFALETLYGPVVRLNGHAWHMFHEPAPERLHRQANRRSGVKRADLLPPRSQTLFRQYKKALGDREAMGAIVAHAAGVDSLAEWPPASFLNANGVNANV